MKSEHKTLYISVAINFMVGAIIGIILFYGQGKSTAEGAETLLEYNKEADLADFFRLAWVNMLWLLSAFFARTILPVGFLHPVVAIRGTVSTFSALYILSEFGTREMSASLLPQCVSILPLLFFFSVGTVIKYRDNIKNGYEPCSLKRCEMVKIMALSIVSSAVEVAIFAVFCKYLF